MVPRPLKPDADHAAGGKEESPFSTVGRQGERKLDEQKERQSEN